MFFPKQNQCLEARATSGDEIVFQTFIQGSRRYTSLPTKDHYARFLLSGQHGADYCNELLFSDCHSFLDLDCPSTLEQLGWESEAAFIQAFNDLLITCFEKHLTVSLKPNDILWSCSTRPGKTSYHIKINCEHYWTPEQRKGDMKDFFKLVNSDCINTSGFHFLEQDADQVRLNSIVDLSVYSANRCIRSTNCMKPDYNVRFAPVDGQISHSSIVQHMLTVTPTEKQNLTPFALKSKCQLPKCNIAVHSGVFAGLAQKYGAEYVTTQGSLIVLRNKGPRLCPIGGEINHEDNAFFVLQDRGQTVHFGCHNVNCQGKLLQVHKFAGKQEYEFYQDYQKLLKKSSDELTRRDVEDYMQMTVSYVDKTQDPFFVTLSKAGLSCFDHQLSVKQVSCSTTLFSRYSDIHLVADTDTDEPEIIKFSNVLSDMMKKRKIPTYNDVLWQPFLAKNMSPPIPRTKLNLFQGFALEDVPSNSIDFEKTQIYDLLKRLCGNKPNYLKYLLQFISCKLQRPYVKHPIGLTFVNSREGAGKGSFATFLKKLFACGENTLVSYNSLTSFANAFNGIQARSLWIVLEEVTAKRGGLREYGGLLKDKISSTTLLCEIKNKERVQLPHFGNIIIFSNEFNVISCSKHDRRLVFFSSDSSIANDTKYFTALYKELASIEHIKSAFDYFSNLDTGDFNYRAIPFSRVKQKIAMCSEKHVTKFHKWMLKHNLKGQPTYYFSDQELYGFYKDFVDACGMQRTSDLHHVCNHFELYFQVTRNGDDYVLQDTERTRFLKEHSF